MLIRYKNAYKKVAMGLLSYMSSERNLKHLQGTICLYETDPSRKLYLWKEDQRIIGVIGLLLVDEYVLELQHISVLPSFRKQGIAKSMIKELMDLYPNKLLTTNEHTAECASHYGLIRYLDKTSQRHISPHIH
ncbi:GNAT family N-acetyltransferase [Mesobacillus foraminis]|uniref:GNAT family N-acetyltransferase n=1 Tax=Mesobacillus foraminis TaxID=279826 RepID=UPI001BEBEE85|nr:GNAT family N-acetyltransferase [Mesobacillus foraminis]MBT2756993.1 GNAT family N-acetyltransferase [Mesobacillus foraminis]